MRPLLLLLALLASAMPAAAQPLPRTIVALYDGKATSVAASDVHLAFEMPLNWLGMRVRYADIRRPLPDIAADPEVRAILISWRGQRMADPAALVDWVERARAGGKRVVLIGAPPFDGRLHPDLYRRLLASAGMAGGGRVLGGAGIRLVHARPGFAGFERPLPTPLPGFDRLRALPGSEILIRVGAGTALADVVAITPSGGYAARDYILHAGRAGGPRQWLVDPFAFFREALGLGGGPFPDVTTLVGQRIYFSHVDGDGWRSVSRIPAYQARRAMAAEVVARHLILPYPDLPVSVAPIAADLDPAHGGTRAAAAIARALFTRPQVRIASHGYTHVFAWNFFRDYSWPLEQAIDAGLVAPDTALGPGGKTRAVVRAPFDPEQEVAGAAAFINRLAPPGKRVEVMQWSGDAQPFPAAIAATRAAGLLNINGGNSRIDTAIPSLTGVSAIGIAAGDQLQIYAGAGNEAGYTRDGTADFWAFRYADTTFRQTERPRRLKPIDIYYNMYSGEREASVRAVRHLIEQARAQPIVPVTLADYTRIAEGFYRVRVERIGAGRFRIHDRGALQTMRFDVPADFALDAGCSAGVLGARRINDSLYVALDPAAPAPDLCITPRPPPFAGALLIQSRWPVSGLRRTEGRFDFIAGGFGRGVMLWRATPGRWRVTARRGGRVIASAVGRADARGLIRIVLPPSPTPLAVTAVAL